jgi:hypothetical protein
MNREQKYFRLEQDATQVDALVDRVRDATGAVDLRVLSEDELRQLTQDFFSHTESIPAEAQIDICEELIRFEVVDDQLMAAFLAERSADEKVRVGVFIGRVLEHPQHYTRSFHACWKSFGEKTHEMFAEHFVLQQPEHIALIAPFMSPERVDDFLEQEVSAVAQEMLYNMPEEERSNAKKDLNMFEQNLLKKARNIYLDLPYDTRIHFLKTGMEYALGPDGTDDEREHMKMYMNRMMAAEIRYNTPRVPVHVFAPILEQALVLGIDFSSSYKNFFVFGIEVQYEAICTQEERQRLQDIADKYGIEVSEMLSISYTIPEHSQEIHEIKQNILRRSQKSHESFFKHQDAFSQEDRESIISNAIAKKFPGYLEILGVAGLPVESIVTEMDNVFRSIASGHYFLGLLAGVGSLFTYLDEHASEIDARARCTGALESYIRNTKNIENDWEDLLDLLTHLSASQVTHVVNVLAEWYPEFVVVDPQLLAHLPDSSRKDREKVNTELSAHRFLTALPFQLSHMEPGTTEYDQLLSQATTIIREKPEEFLYLWDHLSFVDSLMERINVPEVLKKAMVAADLDINNFRSRNGDQLLKKYPALRPFLRQQCIENGDEFLEFASSYFYNIKELFEPDESIDILLRYPDKDTLDYIDVYRRGGEFFHKFVLRMKNNPSLFEEWYHQAKNSAGFPIFVLMSLNCVLEESPEEKKWKNEEGELEWQKKSVTHRYRVLNQTSAYSGEMRLPLGKRIAEGKDVAAQWYAFMQKYRSKRENIGKEGIRKRKKREQMQSEIDAFKEQFVEVLLDDYEFSPGAIFAGRVLEKSILLRKPYRERVEHIVKRDIQEALQKDPKNLRLAQPFLEGSQYEAYLAEHLNRLVLTTSPRSVQVFEKKWFQTVDSSAVSTEFAVIKSLPDPLPENLNFYDVLLEAIQKRSYADLYFDEMKGIVNRETKKNGPWIDIIYDEPHDGFEQLMCRIDALEVSEVATHYREEILSLPTQERKKVLDVCALASVLGVNQDGVFDAADSLEEVVEQLNRLVREKCKKIMGLDEVPQLQSLENIELLLTYYNSLQRNDTGRAVQGIVREATQASSYDLWYKWNSETELNEVEKKERFAQMQADGWLPEKLTFEQYGQWAEPFSIEKTVETQRANMASIRMQIREKIMSAVSLDHVPIEKIHSVEDIFSAREALFEEIEEDRLRLRELRLQLKDSSVKHDQSLYQERRELRLKIGAFYREHDAQIQKLRTLASLEALSNIRSEELLSDHLNVEGRRIKLEEVYSALRSHYAEFPEFVRDITSIQETLFHAGASMIDVSSNQSFAITDDLSLAEKLRIGAEPVQSCQHYNNGLYNAGLASYIGSPDIRPIVVRDTSGEIIARAILRLMDAPDGVEIFSESVYTTRNLPQMERLIQEFIDKRRSAMRIPQRTGNVTLVRQGGRSPYTYTDAGGGYVPSSEKMKLNVKR